MFINYWGTKENDMAKKSNKKDAAVLRTELRWPWVVPVLAVVYFLVTCLMLHGGNKLITLLVMVAAIVCVIVRSGTLAQRLTLPSLLLGLYILMDGISTLYAPSGKFALYEFLKVAAAGSMALLLVGCEPQRGERTGRCAATVLEIAGALAGLCSIDMVSTRWLSGGLSALVQSLGGYLGEDALQGQRLKTIFENPNVFAGCAGIAVLLALGLAATAEDRKERCLHLSCLLITSASFVLAVSRGAMAAIGVAFIVYLLLERGRRRAVSFVLMVETLVLAMVVTVVTFATSFGEWTGVQPLPLLLTIVCAAGLCALDIFVGRPLAEKLGQRMKTVNIVLLAALAAVAALVVLAVSWTGSASLAAGESITRGAYAGEGSYTLHVEADGPVSVTVLTQTEEDAIMNTKQTAYTGAADGATFTAPAGNRSLTFVLTADEDVTITAAAYDGTESGSVKLDYKLLPEAIAERIQNLFSEGNVVQRLVYCADAMKIFQRSPIVGVGMGAFENGIYSVQSYHYQTKYPHNHYIQSLVDTGIIGCLLWCGLLAANVVAVVRLWKKEQDEAASGHTMAAALGATLLFMMIHAAVEVDFSNGYFLCFGYGAFAVLHLACGELVPVPKLDEKWRRYPVWAAALGLAVFGVLVGMNMRAGVLATQGSYDTVERAAELDPYEWADHKLSYVYSASAEEELTDDMKATMYEYLDDLEKLNSNSVPRYLAQCYFNLGNVNKGFAMLEKYVDYTPSNPETWENSFRLVLDYDDGSTDYFLPGAAALKAKLDAWNEANLGAITLSEEVLAYLAGE